MAQRPRVGNQHLAARARVPVVKKHFIRFHGTVTLTYVKK